MRHAPREPFSSTANAFPASLDLTAVNPADQTRSPFGARILANRMG
jgi:hypothetical protein